MQKLTAFLLAAAIAALVSCGSEPALEVTTSTEAPASSLELQDEFDAGLVTGFILPDVEPGEMVPLVVLVP